MDPIEARANHLARLAVDLVLFVRYVWMLIVVPADERSDAQRQALRNLSVGMAYLAAVAAIIAALVVIDLPLAPTLLLILVALVCTLVGVRPLGRGFAQAKKIDDARSHRAKRQRT